MKKTIALTLLTATLVFVVPANRAAEGPKDKPAHTPKSEHKQKQTPFRGKVSAVDKTNKTVTLEGKEKGRTFQITSSTKITGFIAGIRN